MPDCQFWSILSLVLFFILGMYYNKFYNVWSCGAQNLHAGIKLLSITGSWFHWPQQDSAGSLVCCIIKCSLSTVTAYSYFQSNHLFWWHNFRAFKLLKNVLGKVRAAGRNHPPSLLSPYPWIETWMWCIFLMIDELCLYFAWIFASFRSWLQRASQDSELSCPRAVHL